MKAQFQADVSWTSKEMVRDHTCTLSALLSETNLAIEFGWKDIGFWTFDDDMTTSKSESNTAHLQVVPKGVWVPVAPKPKVL